MAVPNIFGSATSAIPLSQLDTNFATPVTIGNTAVQLGNTVTSFGNVTLTNVTISSGNVTVTGANVSGTANVSTLVVTGNQSFVGTGNRITGDFSTATLANRVMFQTSTANSATVVSAIPSGTSSQAQWEIFNSSDPTNASRGQFLLNATELSVRAQIAGTGSYLPMTFYTGGSERMRIDTSGYILGGYSSAFDLSSAGTGQYAQISASSSTANWKFGALSFSADATANGMLFVKSRSATVGTNTVVQSGDALGNIVWRGADGTNYINAAAIQAWVDGTPGTNDMPGRITFSTTADGASSLTERMRIDSSGNLLVGKTATSVGTSGFEANASGMYATNSGAEAANFNRNTSDGTIVIFRRSSSIVGTISVTTSATAYNTSSDHRLKNTIAPMTGALAKVAALKPCTYRWNVNGSDGEGFIAHELAEVVPQCVTGEKDAVDDDGNPVYQGIDTSFLVATLTAAIQELKALVDTQASTITALTARITALEAK